MTTLKDIWPVMTLFYDYIMLFIEKDLSERITETFVVFFSKSSQQVHKVIISKDLIWSLYSIHFVSLHHYKVPSSSSSSHYNAAVNLKASTSPPFSSSNPQAFDHHPRQRGGGEEGRDWTLPDWHWGIWTRSVKTFHYNATVIYHWIWRCLRYIKCTFTNKWLRINKCTSFQF